MLWQFSLNALGAASTAIPLAFACALVYWINGYWDFGLGAAFIASAYCSWALSHECGLPFLLALPCGVGLGAFVTLATEAWVYRPLRERGSSALLVLLASLGIYIVVQNLISMLFGDASRSLRVDAVQAGVQILGGRITKVQILCAIGSLSIVVGLVLLQALTGAGRTIRAIANDPTLAVVVGVSTNKWKSVACAVAGGLAGVSGLFVAMNVDVGPTIGMAFFMPAAVAVIIGGFGSITGVALGVLLIAFAGQFGVWKLSTQWQGCVTFVILLAFMLLRPRGFAGKPLRKVAV